MNTQVEPEREELWGTLKKSLDNLLLLELNKERVKNEKRDNPNMPLIGDLQERIKQLNAEIDDLDRRKRALSNHAAILQKALDVIVSGEMEALDEETLPSKTELVRNLIRESGEAGITRDEIRQELERQGREFEKNFVYSTLARLRSENEITQKEDRYFWKVKTTA
ncbi:MAG: hypothetical protein ABSF46_24975 [Terriglobia bacterium]|jgi:predicted transcriptional regulator